MSNPSPNHSGLHRASPAEWLARRQQSVERIGALLAEKSATKAEIAERFSMSKNTAYGHLMHMERLGLAHRTREKVGNNTLWAAGEKPEEVPVAEPEPVRVEVPATRDPLVAALFGPGRVA
jgi:DNA-binding CsgD family transcriptional regulator